MARLDGLSILRDILERDFGIEARAVVPGAVLGDDIDFDSIDVLDLAHRLEDQLGVDLGDDGFGKDRGVADIARQLEEAIAAAGEA